EKFSIKDFYLACSEKRGGGVIATMASYGLLKAVNKVGTIIIVAAVIIVCIILLTERSIVKGVKDRTEKILAQNATDKEIRQELRDERLEDLRRRREEKEERLRLKEEKLRLKEEQDREKAERKQEKNESRLDDEVLKRNKSVSGITTNTELKPQVPENSTITKPVNDEIHEINMDGFDPVTLTYNEPEKQAASELAEVFIDDDTVEPEPGPLLISEPVPEKRPVARKPKTQDASPAGLDINTEVNGGAYEFPPIRLLKKGDGRKSGNAEESRLMGEKLLTTLSTFGVEATIDNISHGPSITRFELEPKIGVKVSKIKGLSDDIKLSLATTEVRIEAPIPGKSLIGIEIPNKKSQPVLLGDMITVPEFQNSESNLTFCVGKDIAGKPIIYDIDKFPHVLIAGATGSGKSVCINTIVMSILYKAHPDDVKLIMIDPKVVELSVYNGIPHLLLPVVTDAKKAAATLNYAVNEMTERYKKFADVGSRDLEGYNSTVTSADFKEKHPDSEMYKKLPRMVIIVDELADLMMVARNEVEDSICRLAQLARACGIHLIIATQRPSVDVITGLIKANMPSRIAFAVASQIDSRTILDMGGAEELIGKGDMLFFPRGLKNPVRLQGGFVSDDEVNSVVGFLRDHCSSHHDAEIEEKINSMSQQQKTIGGSSEDEDDSGTDDKFIEAGRFIIESQKASIGQLQRKFKMGFNRAARIMDQLAEAGVVGPEEGTKPRSINMSITDFENYIENNL
ncbi:MAG: DNA translocase FtsK, partial [Lachnospiraceae bacterium]|nr:DNA translocase FtsK [Lachnospiraceae bacterium]